MEDKNRALINFGDISKPVEKLIDSVKNGIGTIYEPTKIVRKAKAEAKAKLIRAKAEIEESSLRERAKNRILLKEEKRQANIELIIDQAVKELPNEVSSEKVNEDWISFFFESCQDISKVEMQLIWSKILAKEVEKSNSFSLRTLQVTKLLSNREAKIFNKLSKYFIKYDKGIFLINNNEFLQYLRENENIEYTDILALKSVGLIEPSQSIVLTLNYEEPVKISLFDKKYLIRGLVGNKIKVEVLSLPGQELYNILNINKDNKIEKFLFEYFNKNGIQFREINDIVKKSQ